MNQNYTIPSLTTLRKSRKTPTEQKLWPIAFKFIMRRSIYVKYDTAPLMFDVPLYHDLSQGSFLVTFHPLLNALNRSPVIGVNHPSSLGYAPLLRFSMAFSLFRNDIDSLPPVNEKVLF